MHQHYKDILDRIDEPPKWFDDYGVPRFEDFSPQQLGNIYASEAALAEVSCQGCARIFKVALTETFTRSKRLGLNDEIRLGRVHYGDPPNVDCCGIGASMNSVMHTILEYWSRDYEVSLDWRRDTLFEGPLAEAPLSPPDTVAEVLAAVGSGTQPILVMCTSQRNRFDIAGRITAAMASRGRVLVTYDERYLGVAREMLDGLVPDADVGHRTDTRTVTMADFSHVKEVDLATIDSIVLLAGPRPTVWSDVAPGFTAEAGDKVQIELALAHSRCTISSPNLVVDAGRTDGVGKESQRSS